MKSHKANGKPKTLGAKMTKSIDENVQRLHIFDGLSKVNHGDERIDNIISNNGESNNGHHRRAYNLTHQLISENKNVEIFSEVRTPTMTPKIGRNQLKKKALSFSAVSRMQKH